MNNFDPTSWIQKKRFEDRLERKPETDLLHSLLKAPPSPILEPMKASAHSNWTHALDQFFHALVAEQLNHPEELLKLNPSRRESLARFLTEMSQQPEPTDPQQTLKDFVRIDRTPAEHEAIRQLFKQISFVLIGKALLLYSWNKKSSVTLNRADLKDLTGAVEKVLRPFLHLQTSTCQLIQMNFYSWYKMSGESQEKLWVILSTLDENLLDHETIRDWLLNQAIRLSAETLGERQRYQEGLYQNLWKHLQKSSILDPRFEIHLKQGIPSFAFCPTLRDGSMLKYAPPSLQWMGFEPLTFELIFCEIRMLWGKPKAPFLWVKGSGLEMCMDQQSNLSLNVTHDGKQNVLSQMDGIASCELAFIAEESPIRTQARSMAAQALRKQVEQHPILKKLKHPASTRGMYQACQSLGKLRQNGILVWAREELLSESSGKPALQYILNEAKLLVIADFTALQCEDEKLKFDLPKALYLFKKENQIEVRKNHRPLLIKAYGSIKQASDVSLLFERLFAIIQKPDVVFPAEPFALHARTSPVVQSEWEQHWLNPSDDQLVERIEDLKRNAYPMGQLAVIRNIPHPSAESQQAGQALGDLFDGISTKKTIGFYAWVESGKNGCELATASASHPPFHLKAGTHLFWITPTEGHYNASLQMLLRSRLIQDWLNYSVERKKGAWVLRDHDLKSVPVPKHIFDYFKLPLGSVRLTPEEEIMLNQIAIEPSLAHQKLEKLFDQNLNLRGITFQRAAETLTIHESQNGMLFSLFFGEDQIDWSHLVNSFLPETEMTSLDHHPMIRFSSTLPAHLPIQHVTLIKHPSPGILLANDRGLTQQLYIQHAWLREMTFEKIQAVLKTVSDPTFHELCLSIKLPKNPDQALSLGQQLLKAYSIEKMRRKELAHLMDACLLGQHLLQPQIGLLQ